MFWNDWVCLISERRTVEVPRGGIPRKFCVRMVTDRIWQEHLYQDFLFVIKYKKGQRGSTLCSDLPTWHHPFAGQNQRVCFFFAGHFGFRSTWPPQKAKIVFSLLPVSGNHIVPNFYDSTINTLFELSYSG